MLSFFTSIWSKISAGLAIAFTVLLAMYKYKSSKLESVTEENKTLNKRAELSELEKQNALVVEQNEKETINLIETEVKNHDKKYTANDFNNL